MISFDTNIVFPALTAAAAGHQAARSLLEQHRDNERVVLCELMLLEVYTLLRNPAVSARPLGAAAAAAAIQSFRHHPNWRIVDYVPQVADRLWSQAADPALGFRRIFDARLALTLRHHGVTEFATRNVKDFQSFGFARVWDPLV